MGGQFSYFDKANQEDTEYLCYLNLIMAMFRVTAVDIKYGGKEVRNDARNFLRSDWFNYICIHLNLDPESTKFLIKHSDKISSRSKFE